MSSLRDLYPEHAHYASFDAYVTASKRYDANDAVELASAAAMADTATRIDLSLVGEHTAFAQQHGLLALITRLSNKLRTKSVQPIDRHRDVPPYGDHNARTRPPYPTNLALEALERAHDGIHVDANAAQSPPLRPREPGYHRAMERTAQKEVQKGRGIALPAAIVRDLCTKENMQLFVTDSFIRQKAGVDAGRRCDDYTDSNVNTDEKRQFFADINGDYGDPDMVHFCRLIQATVAVHGRNDIVMAIADIEGYFRRMRIHPSSVTKLCTWFQIDGEDYFFLPFGGPFGLMESNASALGCSEAIHAALCEADIRVCGRPLGSIYVDDMGAPLHLSELVHFYRSRFAICKRFVGETAIAIERTKTHWGTRELLLGNIYDTRALTVALSPELLHKHTWALFTLLPEQLAPGLVLRTRLAQRIASYMINVSYIAYGLRAFSKALYGCAKGADNNNKSKLYLDASAIVDINRHRDWIRRTWLDASSTSVSINIPPLLHKEVGESTLQLQLRQQAAAHTVMFTDASGTSKRTRAWGGGWIACPAGTTISTQADVVLDWGSQQYNAIDTNHIRRGDLHINILEMIVALRAIDSHVRSGHRPAHLLPGQPWHIHVLIDNTPALYKLIKHKATHPLITFLLRAHSDLEQEHNLLLTFGEIKSEDNWMSDAASRQFRTLLGARALIAIADCPQNRSWPVWWTDMEHVAKSF